MTTSEYIFLINIFNKTSNLSKLILIRLFQVMRFVLKTKLREWTEQKVRIRRAVIIYIIHIDSCTLLNLEQKPERKAFMNNTVPHYLLMVLECYWDCAVIEFETPNNLFTFGVKFKNSFFEKVYCRSLSMREGPL